MLPVEVLGVKVNRTARLVVQADLHLGLDPCVCGVCVCVHSVWSVCEGAKKNHLSGRSIKRRGGGRGEEQGREGD